jgi:hypothetical protein
MHGYIYLGLGLGVTLTLLMISQTQSGASIALAVIGSETKDTLFARAQPPTDGQTWLVRGAGVGGLAMALWTMRGFVQAALCMFARCDSLGLLCVDLICSIDCFNHPQVFHTIK